MKWIKRELFEHDLERNSRPGRNCFDVRTGA
jgi:hypothetical protein